MAICLSSRLQCAMNCNLLVALTTLGKQQALSCRQFLLIGKVVEEALFGTAVVDMLDLGLR